MVGIGYAFISAYLKGEEAKMLSSDNLNTLLKAENVQDVIDSIRETDIGNYLEELDVSTFDDVDEQLWKYFNDCLTRIVWFQNVPKAARKILEAYAYRYDILNIKTALQNILSGEKTKGIPAGTIYNNGLLDDLINAENLDDLIGLLNSARLDEYGNILERYRLEEGFRRDVLTDTGMEDVYYGNLIGMAGKLKDGAVLSKIFQTSLDMTNLQIIVRSIVNEDSSAASGQTIGGGYLLSDELIRDLLSVKLQDIPARLDYPEYRTVIEEIIAGYEKDGNISIINESIEKLKFTVFREILSPKIMSPAVIVWYVILKEIEIRNVRLILKAVMDNIPLEEIRDYMVVA
ncbi:MAG: V-type ATPase subunit [Dehalococcoidales bacterium]|nr:MAG: V-type ATPase subunit [Dehalococcoidales bacterium]